MKKIVTLLFITLSLLTGCKGKEKAGYTLTLKANNTEVSADTGRVQIIAELKDANGNGVSGAEIGITSTAGSLSGITDDGGGRYSAIITGLTSPALSPVSVTATYKDLSASLEITIVPGVPYTLYLSWEPNEVSADSGSVTFTARVLDYNKNPVPNADLLFTSSYGTFGEITYLGGGEYRTVLQGLFDTTKSPVRIECRVAHLLKIAEIKIHAGALSGFLLSPILDPQYRDEPFSVVAVAVDGKGNKVQDFNGTVAIAPSQAGVRVSPSLSSPFVNGVLRQENVIISDLATALALRFDNGAGAYGVTNTFDVIDMPPVDHFEIDPISSPKIAGNGFEIVVRARDPSGNLVTNFNGTVGISDTTGTIEPTLSQKFNKGRLVQIVTIKKAQDNVVITVTGSGGGTGTSNPFNVVPGELHHFEFDPISSPKVVDVPFPVIIKAVDANGNQVTSFSGSVNLSDLTGSIQPTKSGNFLNGLLLQQVKIGKITTADRIRAYDSDGHSGESAPFEVTSVNVDHFTIAPIPSPQTAGSAFTIVVEARDSADNLVTDFNGSVTLRDLTKSIDPVLSGNFVNGILIQDVRIYKAFLSNKISVSWNGRSGESNTFDLIPAALNRFVFAPIGSPVYAGQPFSITIEAVDLYGNRRMDFNGTVSMMDLTGRFAPSVSNNFTNGILTQSVTVNSTSVSDIIIVSDAGITGTSNAFEVRHEALDHFSFDADPETPGIQGIASPQRNGSAFAIKIFARDAGEALVTDYNGTVTLSDLTGTITPSGGTFTNGVLTLSVTISSNKNGNTITVSDGLGHTGVSNSFDVLSNLQAGCFEIDPIGTPQIAGVPFTLSVTARRTDCNGPVDNTFNGSVNLTDTTGTLKPYQSSNFANGVLTQQVTITTSGASIRLNVEGAGLSAQSNPFTVVPAGLDHFTVNTIPSPQMVDAPFNITVTAMDAFNNRFTGFNGSVKITDRSGSLNITSAPFIFGVLNQAINITKSITGNHIWVDDQSGHTGASNAFDVVSPPVDHFAISNILSPQVEDQPFGITVVAQDASGRTVSNFDGNVSIEDTTGSVYPPVSDYFIGGVLTQELRIRVPTESTAIRVSDGAGHSGQSNSFSVEPSYAGVTGYEIELISSPQVAGSPFNITVRAVDSSGNTLTDFNGWVSISDSTGTISPARSRSFNRGLLVQQVTVTRAMSNVRITVQDPQGNSGMSSPFTVVSGPLDHFVIAEIPSPQRAGVPFIINVTALDAYNNVVTGFNGTVNIADITTTIQPTTSSPFSGGVLTQEVTIGTATPLDAITVLEPDSGATGTSNTFAVEQ